MALSQDAVRRLTVIGRDQGLTTVEAKLSAIDRAQDRIAVSSARMGRATEDAYRRVSALTTQASRYTDAFAVGGMGGLAGRAGADFATPILGSVARIGAGIGAAVVAWKVLNAIVERGAELVERYADANKRLYGENVQTQLDRLTKFQEDNLSADQVANATSIAMRQREAREEIERILKMHVDLTDVALRFQSVWAATLETTAKVLGIFEQIPAALERGAASAGNADWIKSLNAWMAARGMMSSPESMGLKQIDPNAPPAAQSSASIDAALAAARGNLSAMLGNRASGLEGASIGGTFAARYTDLISKLEKVRTVTNAATKAANDHGNAYTRALESVSRSIALQEADAKAVGLSAGAHARLRTEAQLLEAAKRAGLNPEIERASERFKELAARAEKAANALAKARLESDVRFDRAQLGRSDIEASVASRLRSAGLPVDLDSTEAGMIRLNEQLKIGKDLATDFSTGFARDLRNGVKATEALGNALGRLSDRLMDMAINQAISGIFGAILGVPTNSSRGLFGLWHEGGVVGQGALAGRYVHPAYFENANRFATGGIAGIGPDEVPIIAHRNEEVIRRDDPRHRWNGGGEAQTLTVRVIVNDEKFSAYVEDGAGRVVARSTPQIVGAAVAQSNMNAPGAVGRYQNDRGGEYRV